MAGIKKQFEPLLLIPIAFGGLLSNIPLAGIAEAGGFLRIVYDAGIQTGLFPLFIFMSVGAMTDFGPLIANPKMALLGGAAQFGIFATLIGAIALSYIPWRRAAFCVWHEGSRFIGIIGGADGHGHLLNVFAWRRSCWARLRWRRIRIWRWCPIIQPPIMKLLTTQAERKIKMTQLRPVSKREKILFPLVLLLLCAFLLPDAAPLIGALTFGNLIKESGVAERLSKTLQNDFCNIPTICWI